MFNHMTDRLNKDDWLQHGLKTLSKKGFSKISAGYMARELEVTRGSFYWHFEDIETFHQLLLERWRSVTTLQTIERVDGSASGHLRLNLILRRAFDADRQLERSVRAWATSYTPAANAVATVDRERMQYLEDILVSSGLDIRKARSRARFLYWSYLGHVMNSNAPDAVVSKEEIDDFAGILLKSDD